MNLSVSGVLKFKFVGWSESLLLGLFWFLKLFCEIARTPLKNFKQIVFSLYSFSFLIVQRTE